MNFIADEMLGKLARWLRMGGIDVAYVNQISDEELLKKARQENRIILTRDTRLIKQLNSSEYLFISYDYLEDQCQEFFSRFPESNQELHPLSRCAECNTPLEPIAKEKVKDRVWPYVYQTQNKFTHCPSCDRIYWQATHVQKIVQRLKRLVPSKASL